jgi:hypothetical protein
MPDHCMLAVTGNFERDDLFMAGGHTSATSCAACGINMRYTIKIRR